MSRILTVYYSLRGETYAPGGKTVFLKKGHTASAAEAVHEAVGGDLSEIETVKNYSADHREMILEAKQEFEENARPLLKTDPDPAPYEIVFLGFPNWWNTVPMPVLSFLEAHDWNAKKIIPFVTSGGSGFGNSLKDIADACSGAMIMEGKEILGHQAELLKDEIMKWAEDALKKAEER